ncbi:MAG TPA: PAS domain S-box protein [Deltaproteobacteria bacterium]|nr:PAS domain S-box protein [Deltaproteobacteria bacterium]
MEREKTITTYDRADSRIWWLLFSRVAVISFVLGVTAFIQVKGTESLSSASLHSVYSIIGITYALSIFYTLLYRRIRNIGVNINVQSICDVVLITTLVYVTGGIESMYSPFYFLVIIYTVLFLGRRGGITIASVSSILYGLLLDLEFYQVIHPFYSVDHHYSFSAGYVFSRIFIYVILFYIIALLASFVVEREKKTRILLSEKVSAFDRLDLLHRSIIESVESGIMTTDLSGMIRSFNRAAEKITGYPFHEVKDRHVDEIFPEISATMANSSNNNKRVELNMPSRDGRPMIVGFSLSPLRQGGGGDIGRIWIFQDLTAIKAMQAEVDKSKRLALIGEMSAVLAHELRNPLASISGSIQILQRDLALDGTDRKLMDIVLRGKDQLESLVKDFLLLARPNPAARDVIDIREIIGEVLDTARFDREWNDDIIIEQTWCDNTRIVGNKTEIRQALWNIILNAFQAMPEGGRLNVETAATNETMNSAYLKIVIEDTGPGVDEAILDNILEPFYTTKEKGTGLGLAIVGRIVESHKGKFSLESKIDGGTRCSIFLPAE